MSLRFFHIGHFSLLQFGDRCGIIDVCSFSFMMSGLMAFQLFEVW